MDWLKTKSDQKQARLQKNNDLIRRMRSGEDLRVMTPDQTFFPPRPVIKKDAQLMLRLYGKPDVLSDKTKD